MPAVGAAVCIRKKRDKRRISRWGGLFGLPTLIIGGFNTGGRHLGGATTLILGTLKTVLVLAPHPDDAELGCGGTIARFVDEGTRVYCATFSLCEDSLPPGWDKDVRERESRKAIAEVGVAQKDLLIYRYPVRRLASYRQEILDDLIRLNADLSPQLVLMHSPGDLHQDHSVVATEGLRAFKETTTFAYEMPWNNIQFRTVAFVVLGDKHVEQKVCAVSHYESQRDRPYMHEEFIRGLARTRGASIGVRYAETYDVIRTVYR